MPGTVGDYVRKRREELGLSQPEVYRLSGGVVSTSTLSRLETGSGSTSPDVMKALAEILQTPVEDLYRLAGWLPDRPEVRKPTPVEWRDWRDAILRHPELQRVPIEARKLAIASLEVWLREPR